MSGIRSTWFELLFGFQEARLSYLEVQSKFAISADHKVLTSLPNKRSFHIGSFTTPSLKQLKENALKLFDQSVMTMTEGENTLQYQHIVVEDALNLHYLHKNALIQAASQFNCLEFPNPRITPEEGVTNYMNDPTQGPACALACAAGTVYRNYFALTANSNEASTQTKLFQRGQTAANQINNLDELEILLRNDEYHYFSVSNGYTFSTNDDLVRLNRYFSELSYSEMNQLRERIKIGLHKDVGVNFKSRFEEVVDADDVRVTQAYCSALSCGYSKEVSDFAMWEPLARLVLEATYEATLWASVANLIENGPGRGHDEVYLTFLGGGVFRNDMNWIIDSIGRAMAVIQSQAGVALKVNICHYKQIKPHIAQAITESYEKYVRAIKDSR